MSDLSSTFDYVSGGHVASFTISKSTILSKLKKLDVRKDAGPDSVPPSILKLCCFAFIEPLSILFNLSLTSGIFPCLWKQGIVVPVYKDGDKRNVANYRPIVTLNSIAKVFKSIVFDEIFRSTEHLIINEQHGFMKRKSVSTNLTLFTNFISSGLWVFLTTC